MTTNSGYTTGDTPIGSSVGSDLGVSGTTETGSTGPSTTDRARDRASTAADQGRNVAGTAKDEAKNVASTAAEQARSVVGDARQQVTSQVSDQALTQRDKLSQTLRTFGDDLQEMVEQAPHGGLAHDVAREVSERVRALGSQLETREPSQLLDDARDFARRRPGTFLLGALAAGVVAGRMFRATADGAAAASLADSGPTYGTTTGSAGLTSTTGPTLPATATTGYTAPTPSLDAHTGAGYGTGPEGTGSLSDVPDPTTSTVDPTSTSSSTPRARDARDA